MKDTLPIEVKITHDVKNCRLCKWFWGEIPPYGPYPSFDVLDKKQTANSNASATPSERVKSKGLNFIEPAILQGCRKAPIMTVGINPNLTGYFATEKTTRWTYPSFSNISDYAEYYRYKTIYQEKTSQLIMKKWLLENENNEIIYAEEDGWLIDIERSNTYRWLVITVLYHSKLNKLKTTQYEVSWDTKHHSVILVDGKKFTLDNLEQHPFSFKKNDILTGKISSAEYNEFEIKKTPVKYYQRVIPILNEFKTLSGDLLKTANLALGEDVSQHDMVHCASPGWSSKFDIPKKIIANNCTIEKSHIINQILQSRPTVIIIVGYSSFIMFENVFGQYFKLSDDKKDSFELMKITTENTYFLNFKHDNIVLHSRIIVSPHFSYDDNYVNQVRLTPQLWTDLNKLYQSDCDILQKNKRVTESDRVSDFIRIKFDFENDPLYSNLSKDLLHTFRKYQYNATSMIAKALHHELLNNRIRYDATSTHLQRATGSCQFCDNELWQFEKKCEYQLSPDSNSVNSILAAQKIISST